MYCEDTATLLEGVSVYNYLRIIEDSREIPSRSSFEKVQSKLISRGERLCHTRLNAKNIFSVINQHAISLINYHIGILRIEPPDFSKLDDAVRVVLVKNKVQLRHECKDEHMLLQFLDCLEKRKEILTKQAAILKPRNGAVSAISRIEMYSEEHMVSGKTVDHLELDVKKCKAMTTPDGIMKSHTVNEIFYNEYAEKRVDTRIKTDVKMRNNRPIFF
ncbi:hypothetical protein CWI36_1209p0020 [Hamiltosporidium magnivora]|uniref:Uncharacterized protein n=1 Tax=Hamiltosporidium magnivora TaxID=148818 RepID=A0A4Q9L4I4_9MICR|nr:hypothetical protein CWI36_1209p0020 [Hamiltosporidium magnivora]